MLLLPATESHARKIEYHLPDVGYRIKVEENFECKASPAPAADQLNAKGFRLLKQKQYELASNKFKEALKIDICHVLARYNLACALALLTRGHSNCSLDLEPYHAISELEIVLQLDPSRRKRILEDPDLRSIQNTVWYQKLLGRSMSRDGDLEKILIGVDTWHGLSPGILLVHDRISFLESGKLKFTWIDPDASGADSRDKEDLGTYSVKGGKVVIKFPKPFRGRDTYTGAFLKEEMLEIPGLGRFKDAVYSCSD